MNWQDLHRIELAHLPTPVQELSLLGRELQVDLFCKRDDLTGCALSGNKIRKLEYLLGDAESRGATRVLTCGGIQSNHARATAMAAARLHLDATLFLRGTEPETARGNLALDRLVGATIEWITPEQYSRERNAIMEEAAEQYRRREEIPYVIPEGGSNALGAVGYVRALSELDEQYDVIVCAVGSGGTIAGLAAACEILVRPERVLGICVCDDVETFDARIRTILSDLDRDVEKTMKRVTLTDAYKGPAYAVPQAETRDWIRKAARAEGLVLDPVYTGKAFSGLAGEVGAAIPKGSRVLFLHTGGIFGLLAQPDLMVP